MNPRKLALAAAQAALSTFTIPAAAHAATLGGTLTVSKLAVALLVTLISLFAAAIWFDAHHPAVLNPNNCPPHIVAPGCNPREPTP